MDTTTLLSLMTALDAGTNIFGVLPDHIRARIFAAVDSPGEDTWDNAYSVMISNERFSTLWQALLKHTDYPVRVKPSGGGWPLVPTAEQILTALYAELG